MKIVRESESHTKIVSYEVFPEENETWPAMRELRGRPPTKMLVLVTYPTDYQPWVSFLQFRWESVPDSYYVEVLNLQHDERDGSVDFQVREHYDWAAPILEAVLAAKPCPSGDTDCTVDCGRCKGTGVMKS